VFTGIVEDVGTVAAAERRGDVLVLRVEAPRMAPGLPRGGSVAVDGCCLTAVEVGGSGFAAELTEETLRRTAFAERLHKGRAVNLERPMKADGRFDGHIVQGHVDGVGRILRLDRRERAAELTVEAPEGFSRYLVEKGSVAVDGISLTVAGLSAGNFTLAIIPYTLDHTNLREARAGDLVNLEADVVAKYVERLLSESLARGAER
jgi:riboflavin synthase